MPIRHLRAICTSSAPQLFDPHVKSLHKARAALSPIASSFDTLRDALASDLIDRLNDISRTFPQALDLFCGSGHVLRALHESSNKPHIRKLIHADVHSAVLARAAKGYDGDIAKKEWQIVVENERLEGIGDEELDLVMSIGGLHWVNDLPGLLRDVRRVIKPDGVFLGAMYGGESLQELRIALQVAEEEVKGRLAPRVSPMVRLRDVAGLISGAGFVLTTTDRDRYELRCKGMRDLMEKLKGMGETNGLVQREVHCGRNVFERAERIYEERFGEVDENGETFVPVTLEVIHMIGWVPDATQPRAKRRGSAQVSLTELGIGGEGTGKIS